MTVRFVYSIIIQIGLLAIAPWELLFKNWIRPMLIRLYLNLFTGKRSWQKFFQHTHNFLHHLANQQSTLLILLSSILLFVVQHNLVAKETAPENFGRNSMLFQLVAEDTTVGIIEDSTLPKADNTASDAITPSQLAVNSDSDVLYETLNENTVAITEGGSALIAATETVTPHTRTNVENYTVQPGDTITSIAKQFNLSINSILWSNNLTSYSVIRPGDSLKILPMSGVLHTVTRGDTIGGIANKYQADEQDILSVNKIAANRIQIGSELIIPGGVPPAPTITTPQPRASVATVFSNEPAAESDTKLLWPAKSHRLNQSYYWLHRALDIDGDIGDPVYASEAGKVEVSGWNTGGYGNYVIINHGNGIKTLYAHNTKNIVSVGDTVSRGQIIAYVGSTGRSTGPHIHFEVRVNGVKANPLLYTQ